jgi:hypothetical protein
MARAARIWAPAVIVREPLGSPGEADASSWVSEHLVFALTDAVPTLWLDPDFGDISAARGIMFPDRSTKQCPSLVSISPALFKLLRVAARVVPFARRTLWALPSW